MKLIDIKNPKSNYYLKYIFIQEGCKFKAFFNTIFFDIVYKMLCIVYFFTVCPLTFVGEMSEGENSDRSCQNRIVELK